MGDIYKITNIENNKAYIGQTIKISSSGKKMGYKNRFEIHIKNSLNQRHNGCPLIENAIRKYGRKSFVIELLEECEIENLNDLEDYYINLYETLSPNGYNLMTGGGNGRKHSIISRQKMSKTRTGKTHSLITKQKMSEAQTGKQISLKTKQLQSEIRKKQTTQNYPQEIKNALKQMELSTMPMYVYFMWDGRESRHCWSIVVRSPNKPHKKFASKYLSIEEKIQRAIQYTN